MYSNSKLGVLMCLCIKHVLTEQCTTPNGQIGECTPLPFCPSLLRAFANPLKGTEEFLEKFTCRSGICCASPNSRLHKNQLFNRRNCGYQHISSPNNNKEYFPWLAAIRVATPLATQEIVCEGTLINARYVLTAAHCVADIKEDASVRLGEFYAKNKMTCDELSRRRSGCSNFEDIRIEQIILHPFYEEVNKVNDIALLRLERTVLFTDFIRPVCLPVRGAALIKPGDALYTTVWRHTSESSVAKIKKKTTLIKNIECKRKLESASVAFFITMYHMCTIDSTSDRDLCQHDSGGPVMSSHNNQWHVEGILSYSSNRCREGSITVETRVSNYLSWIEDNMRLW